MKQTNKKHLPSGNKTKQKNHTPILNKSVNRGKNQKLYIFWKNNGNENTTYQNLWDTFKYSEENS